MSWTYRGLAGIKCPQSGQSNVKLCFRRSPKSIDVVTCSFDDPRPVLLPEQLDAIAILGAAAQFLTRIPRVLPRQAALVEAILTPLLRSLGTLLADASDSGEHLVLLPSPALLGLPLHAATLSDGSLLLERNSMSVGPNLATLNRVLASDRLLLGPNSTHGLIAVTRSGEADLYVRRTSAGADSIVERLGRGRTTDIRELDVTKETCLDLLSPIDHAVFLCHGADAGLLRGRGGLGGVLRTAPTVTATTSCEDFGGGRR